jgi:nicotinamide mononucleotide transporter
MSNAWAQVREGFAASGPLDLVNLVLGVSGVVLMARRTRWAFPVGLAAVTVQAWLFWQVKFYAEAKLQAVFFACLVYGWAQWRRGESEPSGAPKVAWLDCRARALGLGVATLVWLAWGAAQARWTDAPMPFRDTFIAAFSVLAQIWQVRKRVDNWLVWTGVNAVAVVAYADAGLVFTACLYGVFFALGVAGWVAWQRAARAAEGGP